uniref:C2H2-type domain-containing protein n=1 Tax=Macrostomum lignano TaxID=282301 RepID=A0A1I8FI73_9PLAT
MTAVRFSTTLEWADVEKLVDEQLRLQSTSVDDNEELNRLFDSIPDLNDDLARFDLDAINRALEQETDAQYVAKFRDFLAKYPHLRVDLDTSQNLRELQRWPALLYGTLRKWTACASQEGQRLSAEPPFPDRPRVATRRRRAVGRRAEARQRRVFHLRRALATQGRAGKACLLFSRKTTQTRRARDEPVLSWRQGTERKADQLMLSGGVRAKLLAAAGSDNARLCFLPISSAMAVGPQVLPGPARPAMLVTTAILTADVTMDAAAAAAAATDGRLARNDQGELGVRQQPRHHRQQRRPASRRRPGAVGGAERQTAEQNFVCPHQGLCCKAISRTSPPEDATLCARTMERPFHCTSWPGARSWSFPRSDEAGCAHQRIHMAAGEGSPFRCMLCPKQFSRSDHLQLHSKRHKEPAQDEKHIQVSRRLTAGMLFLVWNPNGACFIRAAQKAGTSEAGANRSAVLAHIFEEKPRQFTEADSFAQKGMALARESSQRQLNAVSIPTEVAREKLLPNNV